MQSLAPYDAVITCVHVASMVHDLIAANIEDIPASRMAEQFGPIVNHPAWTLSHLNAYAALALHMFDEHVTNEDETARFGYGSVPVPDLSAYAPKNVLLACFRERYKRLCTVVASRHAAYFPRPAPARFRPHAATIGDITITLLVAHPPHHLGQLHQWRRAAGLIRA